MALYLEIERPDGALMVRRGSGVRVPASACVGNRMPGQCATLECYHLGMAARHPRLAVERDPEVQRALTLTEPLLDAAETRSAAAQIRALTLRGAKAVLAGADASSQLQARMAERYGARLARGSLLDLDPPPSEPDPAGTAPATEALRWVRGE